AAGVAGRARSRLRGVAHRHRQPAAGVSRPARRRRGAGVAGRRAGAGRRADAPQAVERGGRVSARVAVLQFPGVNCESETARGLARAGLEAEIFRWTRPPRELAAYDAFVLPGGFSWQ